MFGAEYIILVAILVITGMFLKTWQPPIKTQYIAALMLIVGAGLGYLMISNIAYGFIIAGVVYFKDRFVEEMRDIKDSIGNEIINKK